MLEGQLQGRTQEEDSTNQSGILHAFCCPDKSMFYRNGYFQYVLSII